MGETINGSPAVCKSTQLHQNSATLLLLLLLYVFQLALTLAVTRLVGKVFTYLQQPQVVGEIIAGVLLGPSVLGLIPGGWCQG